jgi:four helix bundle protein
MRRSAVSVPSNIAEGHGREAPKEFARFLRIARGSLSELQTQLYLSTDLNYGDNTQFNNLMAASEEIGRMLRGLQNTLDSQLSALD